MSIEKILKLIGWAVGIAIVILLLYAIFKVPK